MKQSTEFEIIVAISQKNNASSISDFNVSVSFSREYSANIPRKMTYNALRIVSTGIIYRLSNGREWVELAENARFFSMKDQEEF